MKLRTLSKNIYLVTADTSQELAKMFLRFQEHYESPHFRNKVFTLDEFIPWYKERENSTEFNYYNDWVGFNIPGYVIDSVAKNFPDLSEDEKWLIDQVRKNTKENDKYYVIAAAKGQAGTLKHETAHAYYYIHDSYWFSVTKLLRKNSGVLNNLKAYLRHLGYHEDVVEDEVHAYILTERTHLKKAKLWIPQFNMIQRQINNLFKEHNND